MNFSNHASTFGGGPRTSPERDPTRSTHSRILTQPDLQGCTQKYRTIDEIVSKKSLEVENDMEKDGEKRITKFECNTALITIFILQESYKRCF